jgi:hypothetical protein
MIKKKIVLGICYLCLLNGCVQSTAFLGPAYTLGTTGNIYQAGITYSSNHAISSLTGKSTGENIKNILQVKDKDTDFQKLVKKRIKETRKKLNLSNQ